MQIADGVIILEDIRESKSEDPGPLIPDDISEIFRLFEMDIRCGGNSAYYRVMISSQTEKILNMGKGGLYCVVIHLLNTLDDDEASGEDIVLEAWCIIISFFAENLEANDAPQGSDLISDWIMWAANYVGIGFDGEDDDQDDEDAEKE
jgi:hypothetical protein